ncbi:hypothetical protein [Undibacterium aquatile]|uniref:Uncharacterized protein n=1 Tax=Undibacterium aquatile TaxID=1537398 RepID=A0ABR6XDM2_9BURK|nr:hypothetical protein [Undibacterium aquatile]MBC3811010.1 hypothetical protein [Undibacterium aquatile]
MPNAKIDAVQFFNDKYRELVNEKAGKADSERESFDGYIKRSLRLNSADDWGILCASMDVIDDSLLGIENFLRFGIDGPTKYGDMGEKYIRLYGALNATYLQQQAVISLFKISNTDSPKSAEERINSLLIRTIRHKIGAHAVDYENKHEDVTESFVPVRFTLGGMACSYYNNKTLQQETVNLQEAIAEHLDLMATLYATLYEKSIRTIYKSNPEKKELLMRNVFDGKAKLSGDIVVRSDCSDAIFTTLIISPLPE